MRRMDGDDIERTLSRESGGQAGLVGKARRQRRDGRPGLSPEQGNLAAYSSPVARALPFMYSSRQ